MDADRGRVVRRQGRVGKLAVVVAVQNVLVAVCVLVTLYVYFQFHGDKTSEDFVHIQFVATTVPSGNRTVNFRDIASNKTVTINEGKIRIYCTGPYIWHMNVCYKSMTKDITTGILLLKVEGSETPVGSIELKTPTEVCRGLYSIAFLKANQEASLHLQSTYGFKIKNVTMGLSYLLGKKCQYYQ